MAFRETIRLGELERVRTVYAPWLTFRHILENEADLGWTRQLLVEDIDVDFEKHTISVKFAPLGMEKGASIFDVEIQLEEIPEEPLEEPAE